MAPRFLRLPRGAAATPTSPSLRTTLPGCVVAATSDFEMASDDNVPRGPSSHLITSASRPFSAGQYPSASTATPCGICTTCRTPGMALAAASSTDTTFAPGTGACAITAVSKPGSFTSMPKPALPLTFAGVSMRVWPLPRMRKSFGSLSGGSCGTGRPATSPRPRRVRRTPASDRRHR